MDEFVTDVTRAKCFVPFSWVQYSDLTLSRDTSETRLYTIHHQTFLPYQAVNHTDQ